MKNNKKNPIITIIIYMLFIYIAFSLLEKYLGRIIINYFSEDIITIAVRESINSVGYVISEDKSLGIPKDFAPLPVMDYSKNHRTGMAAETLRVELLPGDDCETGEETSTASKIEEESVNGNQKLENEEKSDNGGNAGEMENQEDKSKEAGALVTKSNTIRTEELTYDFLMKNYYTVVSGTTLKPEDIDANVLMNMDMTLKSGNDKPQILIYHTHGQEGFRDSVPGDESTTIVGVGEYLAKILREKYGYNVIHLTDSFDLVNGKLDRSKAYDYAYERVAGVLAENPSIEVVIDLHRDGVSENLHLVTDINGKPTANIMFFNGISRLNSIGEIGYLYNPYRQENLGFSLQMKVIAEEYFKGFARKNYIQAYQYNLHMLPKSTLIEAGAQTNTLQEELNAMEPLAEILFRVLSGDK